MEQKMHPSNDFPPPAGAGLEFQLSLLRIAFAGEPPSSKVEELARLLTAGYWSQPTR
jgi:hypothetical protein